jgi:hypothetical protein
VSYGVFLPAGLYATPVDRPRLPGFRNRLPL